MMDMKRIVKLMTGLLGVLALAGLVVALVITLQGIRGEPQVASPMFQSPIQTPTQHPTPPQNTPTVTRTKTPYATPTSSSPMTPVSPEVATVIAKLTEAARTALTPHPPLPTPRPVDTCSGFWQQAWYKIPEPQNAVYVVEQELPNLLADPHERPFVEGQIRLGSPVVVKLINVKLRDSRQTIWPNAVYYDVPIFRKEEITSVARIFVPFPENGIGWFSVLQKIPNGLKQWPPISAEQAVTLVEKNFGEIAGEPVLATGDIRPLQPREVGPVAAFWQIQTQKGEILFVTPDRTWQEPIFINAKDTVAIPFGYDLRIPTPTPLGTSEPKLATYPIINSDDALDAVQNELTQVDTIYSDMLNKTRGKVLDFDCASKILGGKKEFGAPMEVLPLYSSDDPLHSDLFYDVPVFSKTYLMLFRVFVNRRQRKGFVGSWTIFPSGSPSRWPPISREEAVRLLESETNEKIVGEPTLVSAPLRQGNGFCMWLIRTSTGEDWLLTFDNGGTILNASETDLATLISEYKTQN